MFTVPTNMEAAAATTEEIEAPPPAPEPRCSDLALLARSAFGPKGSIRETQAPVPQGAGAGRAAPLVADQRPRARFRGWTAWSFNLRTLFKDPDGPVPFSTKQIKK